MITIRKSQTADTRTCNWATVSKEQLRQSSLQHIHDVTKALAFFREMIKDAEIHHDEDKITYLDEFHNDFQTGFKVTTWYERHKRVSRHHIDKPEGVRDDIDLVDVLEHIADCVMAGMGRSGSVYELKLPDELLQKAFKNTVELLKQNVQVVE